MSFVRNSFRNSHYERRVPGDPFSRREPLAGPGPGQLELVPAADGLLPGLAAFGLATMITRASCFPDVTWPATSTCSPVDRSERLPFLPPSRTAVADANCQVPVVPVAAVTTRSPLVEVTVPRSNASVLVPSLP